MPMMFCSLSAPVKIGLNHTACTSTRVASYLVDLHEYEQIVALKIDLVTLADGCCDGFDYFVSRELFIVPYGRPDRELQSELS
jgi:hypothetical protein